MTTTLPMVASVSTVPAQRFKVDPEVDNFGEELKTRERTPQQQSAKKIMPILLAVEGVAFAATALIAPADLRVPLGVVFAALVVASGIMVFHIIRLTNAPEQNMVNKERRQSQRSMKRSMKSARSLSDEIPVLTKEHVEVVIRFDKAVADSSPAWSHRDAQYVRNLLLSNLDRSSVILSLVEERKFMTANHLIGALAEMETTGNPLQAGWL